MKFYFIIFFLFLAFICNSQIVEKSKYNEAENYFKVGNYSAAWLIFQDIVKGDTLNSNILYKAARCIIELRKDPNLAITFLQKAQQNIATQKEYNADALKCRKAPAEAKYFLAKAYLQNKDFEMASALFADFSTFPPASPELAKTAARESETSKNAAELIAIPVNMKISSLGDQVNSKSDDFFPLITADESVMIFTSSRKIVDSEKPGKDGRYSNKVLISKKISGSWSSPEILSQNISPDENYIAVGFSSEGNNLILQKREGSDGNLFISKFNGSVWQKPIRLNAAINTKFDENSASFSSDATIMYFSSNRPGGLGGYDLYFSRKLPNGEWAEAQNMGPLVNTPYDDIFPYVHQDGNTLFFSSVGHNSIGGFDVFFCALGDSAKWTAPMNMGYPVNSIYDESGYVCSPDGKRAYFSIVTDDTEQNLEICQISTVSTTKQYAIVTGVVKAEGKNTSENIEITVTESESGEVTGKYLPNVSNGRFLVVMPPRKNHVVYCEGPDCFPYIGNVTLSRKSSYQESETSVSLDTIILKNTFQTYLFEFLAKDSVVSPIFNTKLNLLVSYLSSNGSIIELLADKSEISVSRINYMKSYLKKAGIRMERIKSTYIVPDIKENTIEMLLYFKQTEGQAMQYLRKRKIQTRK